MIIAEAQEADSSDAASTNTLVTDDLQKLPRHFIKLVYTSLLLSLLSLVFVLVAYVNSSPVQTAATIIAFLLTLPHHGALILLWWLQRHQTDSIFPFTPHSPRAIAYSIFLTLTWAASTIMCALGLNATTHLRWITCSYNYGPDGIPTTSIGYSTCTDTSPPLNFYWPSFMSTIMSSLELILITSITVVCWLHRRPKKPPASLPPTSSSSVQAETKIISA